MSDRSQKPVELESSKTQLLGAAAAELHIALDEWKGAGAGAGRVTIAIDNLIRAHMQPDETAAAHKPGCWKLHSPSGNGKCNCGAENGSDATR